MSEFRFKQFSVDQTTTPMKVGTDGVLLGAWITVNSNVHNILDIGTGTGLIALMLAQKCSTASIDAIDIDEAAFLQARENAYNCNWKNRIHIQHVGLEDFISAINKSYDIIVCNPPYFINGWKVENEGRQKARDGGFMPMELLIRSAKGCLTQTGSFNLILPVEEGNKFLLQMENVGLCCKRKTAVYTKKGQPAKRLLMEFVSYDVATLNTDLVIENEGLNNFTEEYKLLTRDFYLNF